MIKGAHVTYFTPHAEELRAFFRDKLRFPFTDVGEGWLIFDLPHTEVGIHPTDYDEYQPREGVRGESFQELSFYTDDIHATIAELKERGIEFTEEVTDEGYALSTHFLMPGGLEAQLYQPHYSKG